MPSPDATLDASARRTLLGIARGSIESGLRGDGPLRVEATCHAPELREPGASFVTLQRQGDLRGCVGTIEAHRPLAEDVAWNAHAAAFHDPRFQPIEAEALGDLEIHISVLSALERIPVTSRADLLAALRPERDGLVLRQAGRRATFLPAVWASLPQPDEFVRQLERKAAFPEAAWSQPIDCFRYSTEEWGD